MERRDAGGERAPQGHHAQQSLGRLGRAGSVSRPGLHVGGFQRRPQPSRLVAGEAQQPLELVGGVGRHTLAGDTAHLADPPQTLREPGVPTAPLEGGHQDFDRSHQRRQIHRTIPKGSNPLRCRADVKFP